jgi:PAS domain S-box-containing protein
MAFPLSSAPLRHVENMLDDRGFRRLLRRATTNLLLSLVLPLLVLLGLVLFLLRSAHWIEHSDQVISEANKVEKLLLTMQSGFRGYRLMGDRTMLATFNDAQGQIGGHMAALFALVRDDPHQAEAINVLEGSEDSWVTTASESILRIQSGQSGEAQLPYMDASRNAFGSPVAYAQAFIDDAETQRADRSRVFAHQVVTTMGILAAGTLVGLPLLMWWLQKHLRAVESSYGASLAASERRAIELQVTLSSIGDAVIATDVVGNISFLNRVGESLTGWSNREAVGLNLTKVFSIFHEQTGLPIESPLSRVLQENAVIGVYEPTLLRSRNGSTRPIENTAAPIRSETGEVLGVILVFQDVSKKRISEHILRESERRLRFLQGLGDATRTLEATSEIMKISTRMLGEHLGVSRCAYAEVDDDQNHFTIFEDYTDGCASIAGKYLLSDFGSRIHAEIKEGKTIVIREIDKEPAYTDSVKSFSSLGISATICYPLRKDGALRAMMAVQSGRARNWTTEEVTLVTEVVERCWATIERALAEGEARERGNVAQAEARAAVESANRFRVLSEVVALQFWTALGSGELDYANQECVQYFGGTLETDILGNAWAQFVHPEDLPVALKAWTQSVATGNPYETEFRLRGQDGRYRWFIARARSIRDSENRIVKWFGTNTDIDELKRARDTAERASRAKDDFLAALSHELRTPLTPVLLTVSELREDMNLSAEIREQLGMMERNIALEARLIDDLLDLTTISRGKLQIRPQPCDAHSLIEMAIEIVSGDALAKKISIERVLSAQNSSIVADPARIQQVIWNLLRNSVKFTNRGGTISIRTGNIQNSEWRSGLRIEVSDSGIGFDPTLVDQIFLPFDQGELTGEHRFGGVGLGLSIARAIMNLHGGRITATSAGANKGATFIVELPNADALTNGTGSPISHPGASSGNAHTPVTPLNLLIVDDHENTLKSLQQLLRRRGHEVVTAGNVAEALMAASRGKFDLVISDLGLPDGTGTELMEKLRDLYGLRGIALSGYGLEDDVARTRKAGFVAHLVKPVQFAELHKLITSLSDS